MDSVRFAAALPSLAMAGEMWDWKVQGGPNNKERFCVYHSYIGLSVIRNVDQGSYEECVEFEIRSGLGIKEHLSTSNPQMIGVNRNDGTGTSKQTGTFRKCLANYSYHYLKIYLRYMIL